MARQSQWEAALDYKAEIARLTKQLDEAVKGLERLEFCSTVTHAWQAAQETLDRINELRNPAQTEQED